MKWIMIFSILILGCSSNQQKSLLEEAQFDLNNQNYPAAIAILNQLPITDQTKTMLAAAYAGEAGFNFLKLSDTISKNQNSPSYVLILLKDTYRTENISNIATAINTLPNETNQPIRLELALYEVYLVGQILAKSMINSNDQIWTACSASSFIESDLIELINSLNTAFISVKDINGIVPSYVTQLYQELGMDQIVNSDLSSDAINTFKSNLELSLSQYLDIPSSCN